MRKLQLPLDLCSELATGPREISNLHEGTFPWNVSLEMTEVGKVSRQWRSFRYRQAWAAYNSAPSEIDRSEWGEIRGGVGRGD
jgi:hypothetical protein